MKVGELKKYLKKIDINTDIVFINETTGNSFESATLGTTTCVDCGDKMSEITTRSISDNMKLQQYQNIINTCKDVTILILVK